MKIGLEAGRPVIHVGFAHTGTTSLQDNIFRKAPGVFYAGVPYDVLGGIFSYIKFLDVDSYDCGLVQTLCDDYIFAPMDAGQRLILSDETFVDQPATYYTPAMMPLRTIAERLKTHFGPAAILFTTRSQYSVTVSTYQVYRKNSRSLSSIEVEPFDLWFAGHTSQLRNLFLRNLDISHAIDVYSDVFGSDAVRVLPLEVLTFQGFQAYRDRLSAATGLDLSWCHADAYVARNRSEGSAPILDDHQRQVIRERCKAGNERIARTFDLPLQDFGYPWP